MANHYLMVFSFRDEEKIPLVKSCLRERLKRLPYRFCPTQTNWLVGNPGFDVRIHVTCSWRTVIEIDHYMMDIITAYNKPACYGFLIYRSWNVKLQWTGTRWR